MALSCSTWYVHYAVQANNFYLWQVVCGVYNLEKMKIGVLGDEIAC